MFPSTPSRPIKSVESPLIRLAKRVEFLHQTGNGWFDGTLDSITRRRLAVASALDECHRVLTTHREYATEEYEIAKIATQLKNEYNILKNLETNFVSKEQVKSLSSMPRFTVQGAYNPYVESLAETHDDGERKTIPEHWRKFCSLESSFFVDDNNEVLSNRKEMKTRAYNFIFDKTGELNSSTRTEVVSLFIDNVEKCRKFSEGS